MVYYTQKSNEKALMENNFMDRPPENKLKPDESSVGVKFSNDIFIHPSLLDKWNVKYKKEDLEDNPLFGKAMRIKKNEN